MFVAIDNESKSSNSSSSSMKWSQLCCHFEFCEILSATENFDESLVIGRGGSAKVYKGKIKIGSILVVAAIKRLDMMSTQGESEFWDEVKMLSKLRHCHLVSLIGYCNHQRERILVYEYMPHGTLADHLHKFASPLSWCRRLEICIGVARGLDYLHTGTGTEFGIIHRDVKCSNILLDERWAAKVSDFGLSKISPGNQASTYVSTLVKGTFGYFDPYYFTTGKLNRKSDVYAFGVILLEVLCRKRAVDDTFDWGIATWAQDSIKEGRLKDIVDSDIRDEISSRCLKGFARLAKRCLDNHPKNRPTMAEVILGLEYVLSLQEKTNSLLQTQGKTIFGRMVDMFYFTNNGQKSGMGSRSLTRRKPRVGANFGSLLPKTRKLLMPGQKIFQQEGALLLEHKLKNSVGDIKIFRAEELEKATMNFAEKMILGKGSYGIVYKGILPDKRVVAFKRSKISNQGPLEQFMKEIVVLGQIKHRNVVRLLGCCLETEIPFLAYEFACNYCLHQHIHNKTSDTRRLSWDSRLRIAHESAGALAYLHSDATMSIIHGDVKSANILLDENYSAKVSDFDATKSVSLGPDQVFTLVQGTLGYLDPEYLHTSQLTDKSDVYSFGVVLAELLTGLNPMDSERCQEDRILATYFVKAKMENRLLEIVDRQVLEEATDEQLEAAYNLVCRCLDSKGGNRPSMKQVTMELKIIRNLSKHERISEDNYPNSSLMIESEQVDLIANSKTIGE